MSQKPDDPQAQPDPPAHVSFDGGAQPSLPPIQGDPEQDHQQLLAALLLTGRLP